MALTWCAPARKSASRVGALTDPRVIRQTGARLATLSFGEINAIRLRNRASHRVLAPYLNVSPSIVSQWERGEKRPAGASLKLLVLVRNKGLEAIA